MVEYDGDMMSLIRMRLGTEGTFKKLDANKVRELQDEFEKSIVIYMLNRNRGVCQKTAIAMGINRNTLRKLCTKHNIIWKETYDVHIYGRKEFNRVYAGIDLTDGKSKYRARDKYHFTTLKCQGLLEEMQDTVSP